MDHPEPPRDAIDQVVEWLITTTDPETQPERKFLAHLVIDALTRPSGLVEGLSLTDIPLKLHRDSRFDILLRWTKANGPYEPEGVIIRANDGRPLNPSSFRNISWRSVIEDDLEHRSEWASNARDLGRLVEQYGTEEAKQRWPAAGYDEIFAEVASRPSRGKYSDEFYELVARLYNDRVDQGSHSPNKDIARHLTKEMGRVVKPSTVKNWVVECRKRGLIAPTTPRQVRGDK